MSQVLTAKEIVFDFKPVIVRIEKLADHILLSRPLLLNPRFSSSLTYSLNSFPRPLIRL